MRKLFYIMAIMTCAFLLSACSTPVVELQHFSAPQAKLKPFGKVEIKPFIDVRADSLQNPEDKITYQEVLKSDNLTSEFLQKSQGVGSSTWYYATDPQIAIFLQHVMQVVGEESGFINPMATNEYVIEGAIHNLSLKMVQTQGNVIVNVKFTGILRKTNGVMLMIMPINYNYITAMPKPLNDKSQTAQFTVLIDQAVTAAVTQMYQMIESNLNVDLRPLKPASTNAPITQAEISKKPGSKV